MVYHLNFIDRYSLESVIYDVKHGYVPHTGKRVLTIECDEYMELSKGNNNIESIVCNVKAVEILNWFESLDKVKTYLQKMFVNLLEINHLLLLRQINI